MQTMDTKVDRCTFTGFYDFLADYPRALTLHNQAATNGNSGAIYKDGTIDEWMAKGMVDPVLYPNTDWWDVIFRSPFTQNHSLSATGGNEKVSFVSSVAMIPTLFPSCCFEAAVSLIQAVTFSTSPSTTTRFAFGA